MGSQDISKSSQKTIIVRVDENIHKKIKIFCVENNTTIQECIENILKERFK